MKWINLHLLACLAWGFLLPNANAQFDEFGLFLGTSAYSGDLTERAIEPLEMNFAAGLYMRKKLSPRWGAKFYGFRGVISGDDAHSSTESGLWVRNLRFSSEIYELGAVMEYEILKFENGTFRGSPYFYAGVSGFYFNPQTELDGKTYNLNRLQIEGNDYSLYQVAIPFGAGFRIDVNGNGTLGVDVGFRKTFTDYLDDVSGTIADELSAADRGEKTIRSRLAYRTPEVLPDAPSVPALGYQRGNPDRKDWFMFFGLTMGIKLAK